MALGAITATLEITGDMTSAAFLSELNTLNTGAGTAGGDKNTVVIVPHGDGQASVFLLTRAQA